MKFFNVKRKQLIHLILRLDFEQKTGLEYLQTNSSLPLMLPEKVLGYNLYLFWKTNPLKGIFQILVVEIRSTCRFPRKVEIILEKWLQAKLLTEGEVSIQKSLEKKLWKSLILSNVLVKADGAVQMCSEGLKACNFIKKRLQLVCCEISKVSEAAIGSVL